MKNLRVLCFTQLLLVLFSVKSAKLLLRYVVYLRLVELWKLVLRMFVGYPVRSPLKFLLLLELKFGYSLLSGVVGVLPLKHGQVKWLMSMG
ncbi:MAG: hypothetical protein DRP09_18495 [Candidatus Thorarchaeota archaeon]|nr:MAG: hypothetical protein DRP09_18495 [Candidatus Thorarchaeota archaeon]